MNDSLLATRKWHKKQHVTLKTINGMQFAITINAQNFLFKNSISSRRIKNANIQAAE